MRYKQLKAFSLAEMLAALIIGTMVLIAVIGIYDRVNRSARAVTQKLDSSRLGAEVIQRIAEDLDTIIAASPDTTIIIPKKKFVDGYTSSRLEIQEIFYDNNNKKQIFEKIIWQTYPADDGDGLVLYRSHSGIALEDKLLDEQKEDWERQLFVPICKGVTYFEIQVPRGPILQDYWTSAALPHGIIVTISFAPPFKTLQGTYDVPKEEKISRTIAIDRTRKIKFRLEKQEDKANIQKQ